MKSQWNPHTRVGGIVAEYNPFHNGHAYQIQKARELGAEYLIVVMSGDFVQRGTPAICSKWERTRMALENGIDLVIELPVGCAVSSAAYFSFGAVFLLHSLGVVTDLIFGCETKAPESFEGIANVLIEEPPLFQKVLKESLQEGESYPKARMKAVLSCEAFPKGEEILSLPNNLLALEYLKALKLLRSPIRPCPLLREGVGHHGEDLGYESEGDRGQRENGQSESGQKEKGLEETNEEKPGEVFKSAGQLREILEKNRSSHEMSKKEKNLEALLRQAMPGEAAGRLLTLHREGLTLFPSDLDGPLALKLFEAQEEDLLRLREISPDLARRILSKCPLYRGMEDFASLLKTKQVTHTRVRRSLLHLLLGLCESEDSCSYARVLGFRRESSPLLKAIQERGSLPLVTKPSASIELRADHNTLLASNLYEALLQGHNPSHRLQWELSASPIVF